MNKHFKFSSGLSLRSALGLRSVLNAWILGLSSPRRQSLLISHILITAQNNMEHVALHQKPENACEHQNDQPNSTSRTFTFRRFRVLFSVGSRSGVISRIRI